MTHITIEKEKLKSVLEALWTTANPKAEDAIKALEKALAQPKEPEQEPVAMRMPKVGDKVVCIEDDSLGVVAYLTAGGSPEIMFDDGSHGTYLLREFAELFRYTTQPQCKPLTDEEIKQDFEKWAKENYVQGFEPYGDSYHNGHTRNRWQGWLAAHRAIEAAHGIKE